MKKSFIFCLLLALSIVACGCNNNADPYTNGKYDTLVSAIEAEDYSTAKSEFDSLLNEILAEQGDAEKGDSSSSVTSLEEPLSDAKIKTVGITSDNFFDYFYIEKKKVPFVSESGKKGSLSLPTYITLKDKYTIAPASLKKETQIAIECTTNLSERYALADADFKELLEVGELVDAIYEPTSSKTMTLNSARTSVYENGMSGYNTTDGRNVYYVFDTFEIDRAVGTLYLLEE